MVKTDETNLNKRIPTHNWENLLCLIPDDFSTRIVVLIHRGAKTGDPPLP